MKPALRLGFTVAFAFSLATLAITSEARAEVIAAEELDEASDAWLHEHCAYRGLGLLLDSSSAGRVIERVGSGDFSFHKAFVCTERPPFWTGPWSPATAEAVACTEPRSSKDVCVAPLLSAAVPALPAWLPPSTPPATRRVPAKMPEPTPPKKVASRAKRRGRA